MRERHGFPYLPRRQRDDPGVAGGRRGDAALLVRELREPELGASCRAADACGCRSARGRACAALLHCEAKEIVFTSGGTESDNLALTGVLQPYLDRGEQAHLITTQNRAPTPCCMRLNRWSGAALR